MRPGPRRPAILPGECQASTPRRTSPPPTPPGLRAIWASDGRNGVMAWWTAWETVEILRALWPVAAVWAVAVLIAASSPARQNGAALRQAGRAALLFAFSALIILCGVVFNNPGGAESAVVAFASTLIWVLFIGQCVASAWLIRKTRSARALVTVVAVGGLVVSVLGGFISLMSVTGDWL